MCLSVSKEIKKQIADKDYIVYKVLRPDMRGPYYSVIAYKKDVLRKSRIKKNTMRLHDEYEQGLHYCMTLEKAKKFAEDCWGVYHVIAEFILPKGSKYIEDENQELGVTNQLILKRKLFYTELGHRINKSEIPTDYF